MIPGRIAPRWKPLVVLGFTLLSAGALALNAAAAVVGIVSGRDNTLYESSTGAASNGAGSSFFAGRTAQTSNSIRRGLLWFDVAGNIPAGATITAATLRLTMAASNSGATPVGLHRVDADWGEGASNADASPGAGTAAQAGDATWRHRFYSGTLWTTAGGQFAPGASATASVDMPADYTWSSTPALVADVQGWLDQPSGNHGWLVRGSEAAGSTAKKFESRESATPEARPLLSVEYTVATPALPATWGRVKASYR